MQSLLEYTQRDLATPDRGESQNGSYIDLYRYRILQVIADDIDHKMHDFAVSFLSGEEEEASKQSVMLDEQTSLVVRQTSRLGAFFTLLKVNEKQEPWAVLGTFRLLQLPDGSFNLHDRNVTDRKHGWGSVLLHTAERFVDRVTKHRQEGLLSANVGQEYLIDWFENRGYRPRDITELITIRNDVESGAIIVGDAGYMYAKGTPKTKQLGPYSLPVFSRRLILQKIFRKHEGQ